MIYVMVVVSVLNVLHLGKYLIKFSLKDPNYSHVITGLGNITIFSVENLI